MEWIPIPVKFCRTTAPINTPQTVRALFCAVQALERVEDRQEREKCLPENAGKAWDEAEDARLCDGFDAGRNVKELAQRHKRTQGSIRSRLEKWGRLQPALAPR